MPVLHAIYSRVTKVGALGALLVLLGIAVFAGYRATQAHASVNHDCTMVTSTMMLDQMPYNIGQQWHYVCNDKGARIINPNQNSYLSFQVYNKNDASWDLYDLKFVSKPATGDFSFSWYDACNPTSPKGSTFQWRGRAHFTVDFSDGTWLIIPFTTASRSVACDPGSPWA
jgi:hypothetical protein